MTKTYKELATEQNASGFDPRGDCSAVTDDEVAAHVFEVKAILEADEDEFTIAENLRKYVKLYLNPQPEVWIRVNDALAASKVITKAQFRAFLSLVLEI